jgi:hypothetical protein
MTKVNKTTLKLLVVFVAVAMSSKPVTVFAALITVQAKGYITTVDNSLQGTFSPNDLILFQYRYDPDWADTNLDATKGDYFDAVSGIAVNVGDYSLDIIGGEIFVRDDRPIGSGPNELFQVSARSNGRAPLDAIFNGSIVNGLIPYFASIELRNDFVGGGLNSDALVVPIPEAFSMPRFELAFASSFTPDVAYGVQRVFGQITSITIVPEPTTLLLAIVGFLLSARKQLLGYVRNLVRYDDTPYAPRIAELIVNVDSMQGQAA